jgi:4-hydroxy-tetrahydrodipicolinate synthase
MVATALPLWDDLAAGYNRYAERVRRPADSGCDGGCPNGSPGEYVEAHCAEAGRARPVVVRYRHLGPARAVARPR